MIVTLEPWEYIHAHDIGIRRAVANWNVPDKKSYTQGKNQPEIIASPVSCISELAAAKAIKRYWVGGVWDNRDHSKYKELPDVAPNFEVRRVRERNNPIPLWKNGVGKGLILIATYPIPPEYRQVEILGFIPYDIAWDRADENYARKELPQRFLKPIEMLDDFLAGF